MKLLNNIFIKVIMLLLTASVLLLTINIDLKKVIIDGVITEVIKYQITSNSYKESNKKSKQKIEYKTDDERINEILESDEVQDLITKYLDLTVESMIDDSSIDEIKIEEDIIKYIKENKSILEEKIGMEITDEMIEKTKEQADEQGISKNLVESIKKTRKSLTSKQKNVLKGYGLLTSIKLRIILIILIIVESILLFILQIKKYKWIKSIATSIISAGILISISSIIVKYIVSRMSEIEILKTSILLKHGLIEVLIGIIIFIIYVVINKIKNNTRKENTNEISKDFEPTEF